MARIFTDLASGSNPTMLYSLDVTETGRAAATITYSVKVSAKLESQTYDYFGADVYPKVTLGGDDVADFTLGTFPTGAGTKTQTKTIVVDGVTATTSSVSYKFSATQELGGTSSTSTGYVSSKTGTVSSSVYLTTPALSGSVTLKDGTSAGATISSYYRETFGTGNMYLDWSAATGASGGTLYYEVERSVEGDTTWDVVSTTIAASATSYTTALPAGTDYIRYRVRARNNNGSTNLYSAWIYSNTVYKNTMTTPTLTSSASVKYSTTSFSMTLGAATDKMGTAMTYTIAPVAPAATTNTPATVTPGTITINSNSSTGFSMTLAQLKAAANDTTNYDGTMQFTVTAKNAYNTPKSVTVSIPIDLGDAPVSTLPTAVAVTSGGYSINSTTVYFPALASSSIGITITGASADALGRTNTFDLYSMEGATPKFIKNIGTSLTTTVNGTELGLGTTKKTVSFYVICKTLEGITTVSGGASAKSPSSSNIDAHYYAKPTVTIGDVSRLETSAAIPITVKRNSSLTSTGANTVTLTTNWTKSSETGSTTATHTLTANSPVLLATDAPTVVIDALDPIGTVINSTTYKTTISVIVPKFSPVLSVREKGVGVGVIPDGSANLQVNGLIKTTDINVTGVITHPKVLDEDVSGVGDLNNWSGFKSGRTGNLMVNRPRDYCSVVNFPFITNSDFQLGSYYGGSNMFYMRGRKDIGAVWQPWEQLTTHSSGSGANGEWVRFNDGTQICWYTEVSTATSIAAAYPATNPTLYLGARTWTFPATFKVGGEPNVMCTEFRWSNGASWGSLTSSPTTTNVVLRGIDNVSRATGTAVTISAIAIGRWK